MNQRNFQQQLKQLGQAAKAQRQAEETTAQRRSAPAAVDFAAAVGAVTPLKPRNQYVHPRDNSPIRVRPQQEEALAEADYFYVGDGPGDAPPPLFCKNGRGEDDIRRLQAKHWPIVGQVDLHGCRQEEVQDILNRFIAYVQKRGVCGEIIHGSGLSSKDFAPVLKTVVRRWLMAHPEVLAYAEPNRHNDGAVLVLLRQRRHPARVR